MKYLPFVAVDTYYYCGYSSDHCHRSFCFHPGFRKVQHPQHKEPVWRTHIRHNCSGTSPRGNLRSSSRLDTSVEPPTRRFCLYATPRASLFADLSIKPPPRVASRSASQAITNVGTRSLLLRRGQNKTTMDLHGVPESTSISPGRKRGYEEAKEKQEKRGNRSFHRRQEAPDIRGDRDRCSMVLVKWVGVERKSFTLESICIINDEELAGI